MTEENTKKTTGESQEPKATETGDHPRHPQPIEPSVPASVRPRTDPEAAPFNPPRPHHTGKDVSPGMRKAPPPRPQQPSVESISRAEDEGMTAPLSRPSTV